MKCSRVYYAEAEEAQEDSIDRRLRNIL